MQDILMILLLVAAIALIVTFIFVGLKLIAVLSETKNTVEVLTKDVDKIAIEVEKLLIKSNSLTEDIQGKMSHLDPVFVALGEIGVTVSHVNQSANNVIKSFTLKKDNTKTSIAKVGKSASRVFDQLRKTRRTTKIKTF